jgi:phosphoribosylamine---glycine ligase
MKVLVIGSGGREHALVWKLRQSPRVSQVFCAPGNAGIGAEAVCLSADVKNVASLLALAAQIKPDLTIVGPELALQLGVVDEFTRNGWRIFGPTQAAARLESSKSFAKEFMQRHHIPTAHYAICDTPTDVADALPHFHMPVVVKADGLAAGKGVVICKSKEEASAVAAEMLSGKMLGEAGARVVIEECLKGEELSFLVLSDGERVAALAAAQDHKRVGEGDTGANTGGMGAYSTQAIVDTQMQNWLLHHIARPVVAGMKAEGTEYKGVLYCGLMMTARGPMVLEFNCRFGDPETQPVLSRLRSDLTQLCLAALAGRLEQERAQWDTRAALGVVLAAAGYPDSVRRGDVISGLTAAAQLPGKVFHAATHRTDVEGAVTTNGGRVLCAVGLGASVHAAQHQAYALAEVIHWRGMHYRRDIGYRAIARES